MSDETPGVRWSDLPDDAVVDLGEPESAPYERSTVGEIKAAIHAAALAGREGFSCTCVGVGG